MTALRPWCAAKSSTALSSTAALTSGTAAKWSRNQLTICFQAQAASNFTLPSIHALQAMKVPCQHMYITISVFCTHRFCFKSPAYIMQVPKDCLNKAHIYVEECQRGSYTASDWSERVSLTKAYLAEATIPFGCIRTAIHMSVCSTFLNLRKE